MTYTTLLFDADDTLFDFKASESAALKETFEAFGIPYTPENRTAYETINSALWAALESGTITQERIKVERFSKLLDQVGVAQSAEDMAAAYIEALGRQSILLDGAEALVAKLSKTHRLAIVTNGLTKVQENRIAKSIIAGYFDAIVISESIGFSKPDPAIFEATFRQLGISDFKRVLMIGDSLTSDIKGAHNAGLHSVWFNPQGLPNTSDVHPTYEVRNFEALETVVCG